MCHSMQFMVFGWRCVDLYKYNYIRLYSRMNTNTNIVGLIKKGQTQIGKYLGWQKRANMNTNVIIWTDICKYEYKYTYLSHPDLWYRIMYSISPCEALGLCLGIYHELNIYFTEYTFVKVIFIKVDVTALLGTDLLHADSNPLVT